jgi:hypothetical protein
MKYKTHLRGWEAMVMTINEISISYPYLNQPPVSDAMKEHVKNYHSVWPYVFVDLDNNELRMCNSLHDGEVIGLSELFELLKNHYGKDKTKKGKSLLEFKFLET